MSCAVFLSLILLICKMGLKMPVESLNYLHEVIHIFIYGEGGVYVSQYGRVNNPHLPTSVNHTYLVTITKRYI